MNVLSTSTAPMRQARESQGGIGENRSSKFSIDAAHPFAIVSSTKSGSFGCYNVNGSVSIHREKDMPLTFQNMMSHSSAETLYFRSILFLKIGIQDSNGRLYEAGESSIAVLVKQDPFHDHHIICCVDRALSSGRRLVGALRIRFLLLTSRVHGG